MGRLERRYWDEDRFSSRPVRERDDPANVFGAFVPHRLVGWSPELDSNTVERIIAAERSVRRLNERCDPTMTLPAEWLIRRAESAASSRIEGVHPSARRLARAEARLALWGEQPRAADFEALRNVAAVEHALRIAAEDRTVTVDDVTDIHRVLMGDDPSAGQLRTQQNWIGPGSIWSTPLNAAYVPPPADRVPELLDDLVAFINESQGHPLVNMAVAHAQFEMIHPFADGNGRTGRAIMQLMLQVSRISPSCTLPISSSLALQRDAYITALNDAHIECEPAEHRRSGAMRAWIALAVDATADAAGYAGQLIDQVAAIGAEWRRIAAAAGITPTAGAGRLLDHLPSNPVLNASRAAELLGVSWRTGARSLLRLESAGILVQRSAGRRNRVYEAAAITGAFADAVNTSRTRVEFPAPPV